jgi:hypothetical protein
MNLLPGQRWICLTEVLSTCVVVWVTVVMWREAVDSSFSPMSLLRFGLAAFVLAYGVRVIVRTWYRGTSRPDDKRADEDRRDL